MRNLLAFILTLYAISKIGLIHCQYWDKPEIDDDTQKERVRETYKLLKGIFPLRPSESLPVNLIEDVDKSLDPTEADLDPEKLLNLLHEFDPMFMSITKPPENGTGILSFKLYQGQSSGMHPRFLDNFGQLNIEMANGKRITDLDLKLRMGAKRKVVNYLWNYTKCPVIYKWKDLGIRFWPRWIRVGTCHQPGRPCSFPPGMHCKQSKEGELPILSFICRPSWSKCRWFNLRYPILAECRCSC